MDVSIVNTTSDIKRAKQEGKLAIILGLQNLPFSTAKYPDDLRFIDMLYWLGVRIAQLTYQRKNLLGDGCGERTDSGLSKFGIQVIEKMNRLGMLVDLSHVGPKSTMEAIETSKDPVVFSHSNCRSICDNVRNKSDEQIKALAEKGGVMGICAFPPLLNMEKPATFEDFLDHMTHAIELVGVDHVGVGLDTYTSLPLHPDIDVQKSRYNAHIANLRVNYPGLTAPYMTFIPGKGRYRVEELKNNRTVKANISKGLTDRGYSSSEICNILGRNFIRVFGKAWRE